MNAMKCGKCGSERVMPNLRIIDHHTQTDVGVEFQANPKALVFKQAHREALRATVCGECGNVELSVENPRRLWKTYTGR